MGRLCMIIVCTRRSLWHMNSWDGVAVREVVLSRYRLYMGMNYHFLYCLAVITILQYNQRLV